MKAWVEYMRKQAKKQPWIRRINPISWRKQEKRSRQPYIWDTNFHFGEWLEPDESFGPKLFIGVFKRRLFSAPLVATAYFAFSTHLLAETARVLGKDEEALEYKTLHQRIKDAYQVEFIGLDGQIHPDRQASYVRALAFGLLPKTMQRAAVDHLVR